MNRFKKGIAICLVVTIFLTTLLGNSTDSFLQSEIRNEVTAILDELIQEELVEIEVNEDVAALFNEKKSREFFFRNQWFDVVSIKKTNGKWLAKCYSDHQETDFESNKKQPSQKHHFSIDWAFFQLEYWSHLAHSESYFEANTILSPTPQLSFGCLQSDFSPPELLG